MQIFEKLLYIFEKYIRILEQLADILENHDFFRTNKFLLEDFKIY